MRCEIPTRTRKVQTDTDVLKSNLEPWTQTRWRAHSIRRQPSGETENSHDAGLCHNDIVASSAQLQASRQPHEPPSVRRARINSLFQAPTIIRNRSKETPYLEAALLGH